MGTHSLSLSVPAGVGSGDCSESGLQPRAAAGRSMTGHGGNRSTGRGAAGLCSGLSAGLPAAPGRARPLHRQRSTPGPDSGVRANRPQPVHVTPVWWSRPSTPGTLGCPLLWALTAARALTSHGQLSSGRDPKARSRTAAAPTQLHREGREAAT